VALFAVLAAVMVLTRKVDWYGLAARRMPAQEVAA
jgi:inner membrane protein involved in colicin E2 resistance